MITMYRVFLVFMGAVSAYMIPEAMGLPKDSQYTIGPGFLPSIMLGAIHVGCVLLLIMDSRAQGYRPPLIKVRMVGLAYI